MGHGQGTRLLVIPTHLGAMPFPRPYSPATLPMLNCVSALRGLTLRAVAGALVPI